VDQIFIFEVGIGIFSRSSSHRKFGSCIIVGINGLRSDGVTAGNHFSSSSRHAAFCFCFFIALD